MNAPSDLEVLKEMVKLQADVTLAIKLIDELAECPTCEGTGKRDPSWGCSCENCNGTGEVFLKPKAKRLLNKWRKTHPKL